MSAQLTAIPSTDIALLNASLNFKYMVIGGEDRGYQCINSLRFFATMEEAEAYTRSIVDYPNNEYDNTVIIETSTIKDTNGGFCYVIMGHVEDEGDDITSAQLFADKDSARAKAFIEVLCKNYDDYCIVHRITLDGCVEY